MDGFGTISDILDFEQLKLKVVMFFKRAIF